MMIYKPSKLVVSDLVSWFLGHLTEFLVCVNF